MKKKNFWKRFWTMDVHNHEGFTLVELIIVIAILAILSSVAVVGYSAYIKKANQQADKTMIAEIKNALSLAMYSDPFESMPVGALVLSTDVVKIIGAEGQHIEITPGSEIDNALIAAFGSNYKNTLKLKYNGWEVASHLNGISAAEAFYVKGSSYLTGGRSDMLLSDVESFTNMAANLAGAMQSGLNGMTLGSLFSNALLDATAEKYGIEGPADGQTWDDWGKAHPQEFSNLLVLATALDSANMTAGTEGYTPAVSTTLIMEFSVFYAFASTCPEFSTVLTQYMDVMNADSAATINDVTVQPVTDPTSGEAWYRQLEAEAKKETYKNAAGQTFAEYTAVNENDESAAMNDQIAFAAIMASLNKTNTEDIKGDLGNTNLFTDGAVYDVYNQYMDSLDAMAGGEDLILQLQKGQIAIIWNQGSYIVLDTIDE